MFDLTKEIKLTPDLQKKYTIARTTMHVVFVATALFVAYSILFPTVPLDFNMNAPESNKNTLPMPIVSSTKEFPPKATVSANDNLVFDASPSGQFSNANVTFTIAKKNADIGNSTIKIKKSYQAFFYPTGKPVGFKDGTLLSTSNGNYYIVSDGSLRKFSSTNTILQLGYPKSAFIAVLDDDLKFNPVGDEISSTNEYPNNTIFAIEDTYYELIEGQMFPFVSTPAFLSQFDAINAIAKNKDFLAGYKVSETSLGYEDGTLASSDVSVFILSQGKSYPVQSVETFLRMGFSWDNLTPVTTDELGIYAKQKQFTSDSPHPDGTIFFDQNTNKHFMIEKEFKRPMDSDAVAKSYSKRKAVLASLEDAEKIASCDLKRKSSGSDIYSCEANVADLQPFIGNYYQITANFPVETNINNLNVTFSTQLTWPNMRDSLSKIKTKILTRFLTI